MGRMARTTTGLLLLLLFVVLAGPPLLLWAGKFLYPFPFEEQIVAAAEEHGLDPLLIIAVIRVESKFNPLTISQKGARGLMQVMPETGRWAASKMGWEHFQPEQLFVPEANIRIGTWYLANLRAEFNGNLTPALAAYNGGRGHVARWLKEGIWNGNENMLGDIPFPETRSFVLRVRNDYRMYRLLYGDVHGKSNE